jgi:hypothetical protein
MNLSVPQKIDAQMTTQQTLALLQTVAQDLTNEEFETSLYALMRAEEGIKRLKAILGVPTP